VPEEEITKTQERSFGPAFVNGKREMRDYGSSGEVPTCQFTFRRPA
jgi:hypothetical protein